MKSTFLKLGLLAAVVVSMVACNNSVENDDEAKIIENQQQIEKYIADSALVATRDSSGMYYVVRKANPTGNKPKVGDEVNLKYDGYLLNGTKVYSSTNDKNIPFTYPFGTENNFLLFGMEIASKKMRVGEVYTVFMPFYLASGSYSQGNIPAYSVIKMNMEILASRSEKQQIDDYLNKKKFVVSERSSDDLVIVRTNTVAGDTIGVGKSVNVKYTVKLLDDTQIETGNTPITTGTSGSITGFDRAVRKMRKGEKIIAIFPSNLGYGKTGQKNSLGRFIITPYSPLQFELEVL